jgi:UDP-N-acetylmuramoylalanine--D-glutamate ligase
MRLCGCQPGIPFSSIFRDKPQSGIQSLPIDLAYRDLKGKIIGITGSNGKTTTTTLVAGLLNGPACEPTPPETSHASDQLCLDSNFDFYSVELSVSAGKHPGLPPFIGSILNLTPDHMDRYVGFDDYIAAKQRLFMTRNRPTSRS